MSSGTGVIYIEYLELSGNLWYDKRKNNRKLGKKDRVCPLRSFEMILP